MTTGTISLRINDEDIEEVNSFCLLGSAISSKGTSNQEICRRLAFHKTAMKALEKIFGCLDVTMTTKIRTVPGMVSLVTLYRSEVHTVYPIGL